MKLVWRFLNLKLARWGASQRHYSAFKTKLYERTTLLEPIDQLDNLIKTVAPKLIYNSVIEKKIIQSNFFIKKETSKRSDDDLVPLTLKYLYEDKNDETIKREEKEESEAQVVHFPFHSGHTLETTNETIPEDEDRLIDVGTQAKEEVKKRYEMQKKMKNWMISYDNFDDSLVDEEEEEIETWTVNYGTPDPTIKISQIPCGGCGALLHCKDTAIPGYIPSEIYKNSFKTGGSTLKSIVCQRCHFLENYNLALQVQVTPDDYPQVLRTISQRKGLVILMVDLLDFPCSIWPGIGEIFGKVPIVVVGNKVDLLPQDSHDFLNRIRDTLLDTVRNEGFATFNIRDVALISAKTGYGVEELITKLNTLNHMKGDVYIVGCTNVGKSSLFNAFLQSDFCKIQALDLIQRATTSVWPGTTLNLLKFPIKRPSGYRQYLRHKRLMSLQNVHKEEMLLRKEQLKQTKNPKFASLIGHIGITKNPEAFTKSDSEMIIHPNTAMPGSGINEKSKEYLYSKWCYDTPGVVQPDQLIHLLTTEELLLTLPRRLILPRTFCIRPNSSVFIAGLARLDFVEGPSSTRLAVFASNDLPITVCSIDDTDQIYDELLGTELFKVPCGTHERLSKFPKLEMGKEFSIVGDHWSKSVKDIVLSSAGWIALTGKPKLKYTFRAWTPEKKGIFLRDCLLPHAIAYSGERISGSVAYSRFKFYTK